MVRSPSRSPPKITLFRYHGVYSGSKVNNRHMNQGHARIWLSSAGEFHPHALQEPYVTVSCHTAPTVQPTADSLIPMTQIVWVHGVQYDPTNE
jgi:hypothetical protein